MRAFRRVGDRPDLYTCAVHSARLHLYRTVAVHRMLGTIRGVGAYEVVSRRDRSSVSSIFNISPLRCASHRLSRLQCKLKYEPQYSYLVDTSVESSIMSNHIGFWISWLCSPRIGLWGSGDGPGHITEVDIVAALQLIPRVRRLRRPCSYIVFIVSAIIKQELRANHQPQLTVLMQCTFARGLKWYQRTCSADKYMQDRTVRGNTLVVNWPLGSGQHISP